MIRQPEPKQDAEAHHLTFPITVFDEQIQVIAREYNRALQLDIDFVGAALLTALSTAIGSSFQAKVQERYTESAILWTVLVGSPGTKKTPTLSHLFQPFTDLDKALYIDYQKAKDAYDESGEGKKPRWIPSTLKSFTYEALIDNLKHNQKGIVILPDEMLALMNNLSRYNKGSDEDLLLDLHSGKGINVTRKCSDPIYVAETNVNLCAGTQPERIKTLLTEHRKASGFVYRLLFSYPRNAQAKPRSDTQFINIIYRDYETIIHKLHNIPPQTQILDFEPTAREAMRSFDAENVDRINELNQYGNPLANLNAKYDSYIARFALILQVTSDICQSQTPDKIKLHAVKGAIQLFDYFYESATALFGISDRHPALQMIKEWQYKLYIVLPGTFTRQEAQSTAASHKLNISQKTIDSFIANTKLFKKTNYGKYEKRIDA